MSHQRFRQIAGLYWPAFAVIGALALAQPDPVSAQDRPDDLMDREIGDPPPGEPGDEMRPRPDGGEGPMEPGPPGARFRGRRGRDFPPPGGDLPGVMNPELIDRIMEVMRDRLPRLHQRLETQRTRNPRIFERAMRRLIPLFKEYMILRRQAPQLAETIIEEIRAEDDLRALARDYAAAKGDAGKQAALAREIESLVRKQFDLRQQRHADRLKEFEKRMQRQQQELDRRKAEFERVTARRDELVTRRVEQIKTGRMPDGPPMGPGPPMGEPRPGGPRPPPGEGPDGPFPPHDGPPEDEGL